MSEVTVVIKKEYVRVQRTKKERRANRKKGESIRKRAIHDAKETGK